MEVVKRVNGRVAINATVNFTSLTSTFCGVIDGDPGSCRSRVDSRLRSLGRSVGRHLTVCERGPGTTFSVKSFT